MHPTVILSGYHRALQASLRICRSIARDIDVKDKQAMRELILASVGTKFSPRLGALVSDLALQAVLTVAEKDQVDVKRYAKVEKIPGGEI